MTDVCSSWVWTFCGQRWLVIKIRGRSFEAKVKVGWLFVDLPCLEKATLTGVVWWWWFYKSLSFDWAAWRRGLLIDLKYFGELCELTSNFQHSSVITYGRDFLVIFPLNPGSINLKEIRYLISLWRDGWLLMNQLMNHGNRKIKLNEPKNWTNQLNFYMDEI